MSRILLFVQGVDCRPKCVPTPMWMTENDAQHVDEMFESRPTAKSPPWIRALSAADRWWLVECENAQAGRRLIALHEHGTYTSPPGRVLARGERTA